MNLSNDVIEHKDWLLSLVPAPQNGLWLDFGCGPGVDMIHLATRQLQPGLRILGIDGNLHAIEEARRSAHDDPRLEFRQHSLGTKIPLDDATVDVAYSHNLIECLPNVSLFVSELARVLKPGGLIVMAHWDWDSQLFNGDNRELNRRLVHAFCDWQQDWMDHADGWLGRRLWSIFDSVKLFDGEIHTHVLTNSDYSPEFFGYARAKDMNGLIGKGLASSDDVQAFLAEQESLNANGRYFYSVTGFAYVGRLRNG
jgi:SAM-dependent methyltransferase